MPGGLRARSLAPLLMFTVSILHDASSHPIGRGYRPGIMSSNCSDARARRKARLSFRRKGLRIGKYSDWKGEEIEKLLMLDRRDGWVDEELRAEFDRRCTEALDAAFEEICAWYPNILYPRRSPKERKGEPE